MTTDHQQSDLGAMSKHHVLHFAAVAPTLPYHLYRPLLALAVHADHRTGLSRPGREAIENKWRIPYSSWHRQMQQLAKLGLIRQTVMGNKETSEAAEYQLLYAPALTSERTSISLSDLDPSPYRGGVPTGEKGREDVSLTDAENQLWAELSAKVRARLTQGERQRLDEQRLDKMACLKRTALRIAQQNGGEYEVITALTEQRKPGQSAYGGVRNIPAAMWARVRTLADRHGFDMADQTPVVVASETSAGVPDVDVTAALDATIPGFARVFAGIGTLGEVER